MSAETSAWDGETPQLLRAEDLKDAWPVLSGEERLEGLRLLTWSEAEDFIRSLPARDQAELLLATSPQEARAWLRLLPPDDVADVIQATPDDDRGRLLALLDDAARKEVVALLAYAEDDAGGLMNPRYARLRPEMTRRRGDQLSAPPGPRAPRDDLLRLRPRPRAAAARRGRRSASCSPPPPDRTVRDIMQTDVVTVAEDMDQEAVAAPVRRARLPRHPGRRRRRAA